MGAPRVEYPLTVTSEKVGNARYEVIARNRGYAPCWVRVEFLQAHNIRADAPLALEQLVPAGSTKIMATLSAQDVRETMAFRLSTAFSIGDPDAVHDPQAVYRLPYPDDRSFAVSQAPGGPITTHTTPAAAEAVDFDMPEGTAVLAARAGIVVEANLNHGASGTAETLLDKANFIRILQADGTLALYAHLKRASPLVSTGDAVAAGQQIAWSGNTGYSSGPHLHFAVQRNSARGNGYTRIESLPVQFMTGKGVVTARHGESLSGPRPFVQVHPTVARSPGKADSFLSARIREWATDRPPLFWVLIGIIALLLALMAKVCTNMMHNR